MGVNVKTEEEIKAIIASHEHFARNDAYDAMMADRVGRSGSFQVYRCGFNGHVSVIEALEEVLK
ncbi:TPA_asm: hypothetical protein vir530_00027 [dsDNA virus vir530]|nr:TPA_asm: hypothetical protein vir530_00027 [dsDNA virus vir530]